MNGSTRLLKENPVFASLNEQDLVKIQQQAALKKYSKGEIITHYGDSWPYILWVGSGEVQALKISAEGRKLLVAKFSPGELFWGLAFFEDHAPMPVTLEARTASMVYLWSRESLQPVFMRHPKMIWELCRLMVNRMARASELVEEQAFQPITGRLARLLLDTFESAGGISVARYLTLDEMAARIGTTREMVCRVLYQFSDQELIEVTRTEFMLLNKADLHKLAEQG